VTDTRPLTVGLVQMRSGLSRDANIATALEMIGKAAADGARLIATPEMTNVVDRNPKRLLAALPEEGALGELEAFADAAQQHQCSLLIGSCAVKVGNRAANRAYLFGPDGHRMAAYDKLHMFDVSLPGGEQWTESAVYTPGDRAVLAQLPDAALGLTICYDVRFPGLYRALAQAGAEILAVPAAFTAQTGQAHWEPLLRARAIENGAFVIAPAQGGTHDDGRQTWGRSMVVDPWGAIVACLDHDEPGILMAQIDLARVDEARQRIPNLTVDRPAPVHIYER